MLRLLQVFNFEKSGKLEYLGGWFSKNNYDKERKLVKSLEF